MVDLKAEWQEAMARKRTMSYAERKRMGAKGELSHAKPARKLMFCCCTAAISELLPETLAASSSRAQCPIAATPEGAFAYHRQCYESGAAATYLSTAGARVMVGSVYFLTIILLAVKMFHSKTHIGRSWQNGDGRLGWYMILGLVVNFGLWLNVAISDPGFLPAGQVGVASVTLLGSRVLADRHRMEQHKQQAVIPLVLHHSLCFLSCCQQQVDSQ